MRVLGGPMLLFLLGCAGLLPPRAAGEVYRFDKELLPEAQSLHFKYLFYAYAQQDAPGAALGVPEMHFQSLRLHKSGGEALEAKQQAALAVQVGILPWEDWRTVLNPAFSCAYTPDSDGMQSPGLKLEDGPSRNRSHLASVGFKQAADFSKGLQKTGVYAVVVVNCGATPPQDIVISGTISIKNPFGFLPAIDYYKMPIYGVAVVLYAVIALVWVALLTARREHLVYMHHGLALVAALGAAEASFWWFALRGINAHGEHTMLLSVAEVFSILKNFYFLTLMLAVGLGIGVTVTDMDNGTYKKIVCLSALYALVAVPKVCVLSIRAGHLPKAGVVAVSVLPVAVLTACLLCWIFRGMAQTMRVLREDKHEAGLRVYQRMSMLCGAAAFVAAGAFVAQVLDHPGRDSTWWLYHVFWNDGVSVACTLLALLALMCLWAPGEGGLGLATVRGQQLPQELDLEEDMALTGPVKAKVQEDVFEVGGDGDPEEDGDAEVEASRDRGPLADTIGAAAVGGVE